MALLLTAQISLAQNRIGIDIGAGFPTFRLFSSDPAIRADHSSASGFAPGIYFLRKVDKHIYAGLRTTFEQYSTTVDHSPNHSVHTHIDFKADYLHFGPLLDVGVGHKPQFFHVFLFANVGFLMKGEQIVNNENTSSGINKIAVKLGFGLRQQLPLSKTWYVSVSEAFGFTPFNELTNPKFTGNYSLNPGYLTLQLGIMHKIKDRL